MKNAEFSDDLRLDDCFQINVYNLFRHCFLCGYVKNFGDGS